MLQKYPEDPLGGIVTLKSRTHSSPSSGKQELYDGAGIYISSVEINNIHVDAGKRPSEILNKLLEYFFDLQTLAADPNQLNKTVTRACIGNYIYCILFSSYFFCFFFGL